MRRASPGDEQKDFGPLAQGEATILFDDIDSVAFEYYGAENDFTDPKWVDTWEWPGRIPQLIRIRVRTADGSYLPAAAGFGMLVEHRNGVRDRLAEVELPDRFARRVFVGRSAARGRQEIRRNRSKSRDAKTSRDIADVIVESAVFMNDQHRRL